VCHIQQKIWIALAEVYLVFLPHHHLSLHCENPSDFAEYIDVEDGILESFKLNEENEKIDVSKFYPETKIK
jgi:hypothetical protein